MLRSVKLQHVQILTQFLSDEKETGHHKLFMRMLTHKLSLFSTNPIPRAHRSKKLRLVFSPYTHTLQLFPATGVNRGWELSAAAYIESIKGSYLSAVRLSVIYLQRKGVSYWPVSRRGVPPFCECETEKSGFLRSSSGVLAPPSSCGGLEDVLVPSRRC